MEIDFCPRWLLRKYGVSEELQTHVGMLVSLASVLALLPILIRLPHICIAQKLLGIPCPGCGITHSILDVLHLKFRAALTVNPAGLLITPYLLFQVCCRIAVTASVLDGMWLSRVSRIADEIVLVALFSVWFARLLSL